MRRTKAAAQETREEIFRAGVKVFAEKGYAAATLTDVAREAGCTRGAIYWHFRNKEAFFLETTQRLNRFYDELVTLALEREGAPLDLICDAVTAVIGKFTRDREFRQMQELAARAAIGRAGAPESRRPIGRAGGGDRQAMAMLERAIDSGDIYDRWDGETALRSLASYISGIFLMIIEENLEPTDEEIDNLVAFIRRGFSPVGRPGTEGDKG